MASPINETAAGSSSSSLLRSSADHQNHYKYEVFLSFRGDTRYNFTDYLYKALRDRGIETFRDADKLRIGEEISPALLKAIEESRVSIVVFSENYASSWWCLEELVKILECRKSKGQVVKPVFYKVDPSHVRHQIRAFGGAFDKLCGNGGRYEKSRGKWKKALKEAADLLGWQLEDKEYETEFIKRIVEELSPQLNLSCDWHVAEHPIGVESSSQDVVDRLLKAEEDSVRMVAIWGPGGIGKTTIANAVFNSIRRKFDGCCFLANVRSNSSNSNGLAELQEKLLFKILREPNLKVSSVDEGVGIIKARMREKKVLLVLDDLSDLEQLKKLVPSLDYFGPGSRILITTRDKGWLTGRVDGDAVYEVQMLGDDQALKLFSLHAFQSNEPLVDYRELARRAVHYAKGLPLALTVLGSHLFGRSREEWEATLGCCKGEDPYGKITNILKISYNALEVDLQGYFLDIACFYKGECVDNVKPILEACYDLKSNGIKKLQEKALIRIDHETLNGDRIWMHDLIEEMGKEIVYQESRDEPGVRSRVWSEKDVDHVLRNNTGTDKVIGIQIGCQDSRRSSTIHLNAKSFSKMKKLRYIFMCDGLEYESFSGDIDYLSDQLRWLDWVDCPFQCFPSNFHAKKLVYLDISWGCGITRLWEGRKEFSRLTYMDLGCCTSLKELPDFSEFPILKKLDLGGCTSLVEVPDSIRFLHNLETLRASGCSNLTTLPCSIYGLQNLEFLFLRDCSKLVRFPTNTRILNVDGRSLSLPKLVSFLIEGCSLSDCDFLMTLDCWETLECLNLSRNNFVSLPDCLSKFVKLRMLDLEGCKRLRGIPELPPSVDDLRIRGCESLDREAWPSIEDDYESVVADALFPPTPELPPYISGCELQEERLSTLTDPGAVIEAASPSIEEPTPSSWLSLSSETPKRHRTTEESSPTPVNPPKSQRTAAGGGQASMVHSAHGSDLQIHESGVPDWRLWPL